MAGCTISHDRWQQPQQLLHFKRDREFIFHSFNGDPDQNAIIAPLTAIRLNRLSSAQRTTTTDSLLPFDFWRNFILVIDWKVVSFCSQNKRLIMLHIIAKQIIVINLVALLRSFPLIYLSSFRSRVRLTRVCKWRRNILRTQCNIVEKRENTVRVGNHLQQCQLLHLRKMTAKYRHQWLPYCKVSVSKGSKMLLWEMVILRLIYILMMAAPAGHMCFAAKF